MKTRRNQIMALVLSASMAVSTILPSVAVYAEGYDADGESVEIIAEETADDYADEDMVVNVESLETSNEEVLLEEDEGTEPSDEEEVLVPSGDDIEEEGFWEELIVEEETVENAAASDHIAYSGETVGFYTKEGKSFGMLAPQDGSSSVLDGDYVRIYIVPKNTTIYNALHWGLNTDEDLAKDVDFQSDGAIALSVNKENCGYGIPVAVIKAEGGFAAAQYYLCIPAEEKLAKIADYTAVDAALAKVPGDLTGYTEESAKEVSDAVDAVFRYKSEAEQADVDAMAKAIEDALAALERVQVKVEVTFAAKNNSTDEAIENAVFTVTDADGNVVEGVDGKYVLIADASYKVDINAPDYRSNTVTYTAKTDETEYAFGLYKLNYNYTLQVCLAAKQYAESTPAGTNRGEVVTIQKEGEEPQTVTTEASNYTLNNLEPGATYTIKVVWPGYDLILSQDWSVEKHGYYFETDGTTEWSLTTTIVPVDEGGKEHIDNLIARFIKHEEEVEVDFTAVDDALAAVPENLRLFTSDSADAVRTAVNAVNRESKSQEEIDAMASAITAALQGLIPKDGTYEVTINKYNGTPYYLYEGLGDSDKNTGKAVLVVEGGRMSAQLLLKNQSYGQVYLGTKEEAVAAATAAGTFPDGTIEVTLNSEKSTVNGKSYSSSSVTVPVPALQTKIDYAYHSSNSAKYDHTTAWYDHGAMYLANSLIPIEVEQQDEVINLSIYDEELMFKIVNAFVEIKAGKAEFVFCLSGEGYEDVFAGTYDEAIANGNNKENWLHYAPATVNCVYETPSGVQNDGPAEKYQFRVPVEIGNESVIRIPIVAISHKRQQEAETANPEKPDYSGAFTARQALINLNAGTVRTGNYKDEFAVTVKSNIETFAVEEGGILATVGTPLANEYTCQPTITMKDNVYDKAFIGSAEGAAKAANSALISISEDKSFVIKLQNSLGKTPQITDGKATVAFRVAATEKWVERTFAIDTEAKTITIDGEEVEDSDYEIVRLSIYDEELMFKVVNAYIEKSEEKAELVFALSAKGYEEVFAGTYDEAIANGTNKENWIRYTPATVECVYETKSGIQNDGTAEKYQFRVPIELNETGETRIPIVAISHSRAVSAETANPEKPDYSEAFTARQALINIEEKTVRIGNYQDTVDAAVTSNIESMKVEAVGEIFTIGTPQANEYTCQPTFTLSDDTYDAYFKGNAAAAVAAGAAITEIGEDGKVTVTYKNSLGKTPEINIETGKVTVAFRVAKTGAWIDCDITINTDARTISIAMEALQDADYTAVDAAIAKIPRDLSKYTDESAKAVTDAVAAVIRDKKADEQEAVDAMAKAIEDAVSALKEKKENENIEKKANYAAVDAALKKIPADLSKYTDDSVKAVTDAKAAVVRNLPASKQSQVDAMAKKIEAAVAALKKKPVAAAAGTKLTQGGAGYKVLAGSKTVSYTGPTSKKVTSATIPNTVTVGGITYKVTAIAANAFKNCKKLKSVKIGSNITTIGKNAFRNCTALKSVTIPKKVTTIGANAFAGCKSLTKVTIKSSVLKKVGKKAFSKAGSKNYKKLTVKVPKKKLKAYKSLLKKAKLSTKATVKK